MEMETAAAAMTEKYGAKFLFQKTIRINIPLFLYFVTSYMIPTVLQSFTYHKVCLQYGAQLNITVNCSDTSANKELLSITTDIRLLTSAAFCLIGFLPSALIGRLGDTKSRKAALLIPFTGLVLETITLLMQSYYMELSVYWLIGSEALFAAFGGYMSIISSFFGYATDSVRTYPPKYRSGIIALLEGVIGLGGVIGYPSLSLLKHLGFSYLFTAFLIIHVICFVTVFLLPPIKNGNKQIQYKKDIFGFDLFKWLKQEGRTSIFLAVVAAFSISFFALMGSIFITFYYLKSRFEWDVEMFGYLKGPAQGLEVFNTLVFYPLLRAYNLTDRALAIIGVISRALGLLWLAVTWNTGSTFLLIFINSFSRFAPSGMRAISANIVPVKNHGSMFTVFAVAEAFNSFMASIIIHKVFQLSLPFTQLPFYILSAVMLIPAIILCVLPVNKQTPGNEFDRAAATNTN